MNVVKIMPAEWRTLSEAAHLVVFSEKKSSESDRLDYALMVEDKLGTPMQYVTCRELDAETLHWQYGGSFPGTKDTILSYRATQLLLRYIKEAGFKRISCYVENTNAPMLKLAMKVGFLISGVRNFKGSIMLEHVKEFE